MLGRRLVQEYAAFYRKYMPGCENMEVVSTGTLLGVRESRRIVGEYEMNYRRLPGAAALSRPDRRVLQGRRHSRLRPERRGVPPLLRGISRKLDQLKKGESYGIPYGVLVPKGWGNLWVAGRCASTDIKVQGAIRDQPSCSMMGQAAGTAAVQSIRSGQPAYELDTEQLVATLRSHGAYLPQAELSKTMTR